MISKHTLFGVTMAESCRTPQHGRPLPSLKTVFNTLFIMLSLQVLTLAEVFKVPLRRAAHAEVEFAISEGFESEQDNLRGKPGQGYYLEVMIGTPPQKLNVLVDTGSSNFAVACAPHPDITTYFDRSLSSTFEDLSTEVYVPYTQGNWDGQLGRDNVTLASLPDVSVTINIACITSSDGFFINGSHWQGILGLGYATIARPDDSVEPYYDSLTSQADVDDVFSMQLCGTTSTDESAELDMGGTMIIGGIDKNLYQGDKGLLYTPIANEWYYEVVITDIKVDSISIDMDCKEYNFDKSIVDSGTTNLRLPDKVFKKVCDYIRKNTLLPEPLEDGFLSGDQLLCWPEDIIPMELEAFPMLTITLAETRNTTFDLVLSPLQYLRSVDETDDASSGDKECFKFAIASSNTGAVLGAVMMEGFYVVFDRANKQVGFGQTTCPNHAPDITASNLLGPHSHAGDTHECQYIKPVQDQSTLVIVAYVMAGICGLCLLPLIAMLLQWQYARCRRIIKASSATDIGDLLKNDDDIEQ